MKLGAQCHYHDDAEISASVTLFLPQIPDTTQLQDFMLFFFTFGLSRIRTYQRR